MQIKFFRNIANYFSFSKSQQAGLIIMLVLILLILLANFLFPYFVKDDFVTDDDFLIEIEAFSKSVVQKDEVEGITDPFPFDPNIISFSKMQELGLSEYQAQMIEKYRDAGGRFYTKENFKKIYSITDKDFEILEPYIIISKPEEQDNVKNVGQKLMPKPFNPNDVDSTVLCDIGLNQRQVTHILKYREAGGKFRVKGDFRKIYSISNKDYEVLQKYILLPSAIDSTELNEKIIKENDTRVEVRPTVEINSADTAELTKLYGIGPYYAKKIVAYRNNLGGFYDKSQLLEVFGIDSARYFKFENQVIIKDESIKKFNLNRVRFNEILKHPYFEYYMVKAIFNLKDATGGFNDISELRQIDLLYDELYEKIRPYITVGSESESDIND